MKLSHVHARKAYGGVDLQCHSLQTSALDGGFGTLPGAAAPLPGKECLVVSEQKTGWVPEPTQHASKNTKIAYLCRKSDYYFWAFDPIANQFAKYTIPASLKIKFLLIDTQGVLRGICHTSGERPYRYNQTYLLRKLTCYGNNDARSTWSCCGSTYCTWFTCVIHTLRRSVLEPKANTGCTQASKVLGTLRIVGTDVLRILLT